MTRCLIRETSLTPTIFNMRHSRKECLFSLEIKGEKLKKVILEEYVRGWSLLYLDRALFKKQGGP